MAQDISLNISANLDGLQKSISDVNKSLGGLETSIYNLSKTIGDVSGKESFSKLNDSAKKTKESISGVTGEINKAEVSQGSFIGTTLKTATAAGLAAAAWVNFAKTGLQITDAVSKVGASLVHFDGGLFSSIKSVAILGGGLFALGSHMSETADSGVGKLTARMVQLSGVILGGVAYAVSTSIIAFGNFAYELGTKLVDANVKAVDSFSKLEKQTLIFTRTMEAFTGAFGDSVGTADKWTKTINELSDATGFTRANLKFATTEIVASTSQMGFNEAQMKKLLNVVVDYGTITGDVSQATIDFIGALNGNSQSVIKYGLHLNDASIQQDLLKKGVEDSFDKFSDHEKVTARFNTLLDKYSLISGKAAAVAGTLAGQQQLLANNQERLAQAYGRGAAIVENVNVLNYALNTTLSLVNEKVVASIGFFGALGSRVLQVGGLLLSFSFKIAAVLTAFKTLNVFLNTDFSKTLFAKSIPFVNKSLNDLVSDLGGAGFKITNIKTLFQAAGTGIIQQYKLMIAATLGLEVANLTLGSSFIALAGIIQAKLISAFVALRTVMLSLLTNPIVLGVSAIIGVVYLLKVAIEKVEEKTGIFTKAFNTLTSAFSYSVSILQPVYDFFVKLKDIFFSLGDRVIGVFAYGVTSVTQAFLQLLEIASPVLKFLGVDFGNGLRSSINEIEAFNNKLVESGFKISEIPDVTQRAIASTNKAIGELDLEKLKTLSDELRDVGLKQIDLIKRERDERLITLNKIFPEELRQTQRYTDLKIKIEQDFNIKRSKLEQDAASERDKKRKEEAAKIEKQMKEISDSISSAASSPFKAIGESLSSGKSITPDQGVGVAAGLAGSLSAGAQQGAAGAGGFLTSAVSELVPVFGSMIKQVLDLLGTDPALFSGLIRGFIDGAVQFVENIILNIPTLITELSNGFSRILEKIIKDMPMIIQKFAEGIGEAAIAFSLAMPNAAITFAASMIEQAPAIAKALIEAIPRAGGKAVSTGGGIFKKLGFADGGVPSVKSIPHGFPNDTFPMRGTSGELIVDRSTTGKLIDFLNSNQGQSQGAPSQNLMASFMSQPIVVNLNGREIARAVRSEMKAGFVL